MKWWRYIFDERLPIGCRLLPACITCPACCYGKKLHEKEILGYDREEETKKIIERKRKKEGKQMIYEVEGIITIAGGLFGYDVAAFRFDDNHVFNILLPHDKNARHGDKVKLTVTKEE